MSDLPYVPPTTREGQLAGVAKELAQERASAMARITARLVASLERLRAEGERAPGAKQEAERHLWYLLVQREALGLRRHDDVYHALQIPKTLVPRL